MDLITIGGRIRMYREKAEMSGQQLADAVGISQTLVSQLESGSKATDVLNYIKIADALGIEIGKILSNNTNYSNNIELSVLSDSPEKYKEDKDKVIEIYRKKDLQSEKIIDNLFKQLDQRNEEVNKILAVFPELTKLIESK